MVTAFRYYKASEAAEHRGYVYDLDGTMLATTGPFADNRCRNSGWVEVPVLKPFRTMAGARYVVAMDVETSYHVSQDYLFKSKARADLSARAGVYGLTHGALPATSSTENYWVDGTSCLVHVCTPSSSCPRGARRFCTNSFIHVLVALRSWMYRP